jgi:hypothetical protein
MDSRTRPLTRPQPPDVFTRSGSGEGFGNPLIKLLIRVQYIFKIGYSAASELEPAAAPTVAPFISHSEELFDTGPLT